MAKDYLLTRFEELANGLLDENATKVTRQTDERAQDVGGLRAGIGILLAQQRHQALFEEGRLFFGCETPRLEMTDVDPEIEKTLGENGNVTCGGLVELVSAHLTGRDQPELLERPNFHVAETTRLDEVLV